MATAARNADSLKVLPKVRKSAAKWHVAAGRYKLAADTSFAAYVRQVQANGSTQLALRDQKVETARQESYVKEWKGKARRRNFWGWMKAAGGVLIGLGIGAAAR